MSKKQETHRMFQWFRENAENPITYTASDTLISCDKGAHKERTLGNEQKRKKGHKEYWKKAKKQNFLASIFLSSIE